MIEKQGYGAFMLCCDKCNEFVEGFSSWNEVIDYKKEKKNGWGSRMAAKDKWIDLCPDCLGKWNNEKYGINKKTTKETSNTKNFTSPTFKGWEILKRIAESDVKLGQKIRLVTVDDEANMQNSDEIFVFNGMDFVSEKNLQGIGEQMTAVIFGASTFEYVV